MDCRDLGVYRRAGPMKMFQLIKTAVILAVLLVATAGTSYAKLFFLSRGAQGPLPPLAITSASISCAPNCAYTSGAASGSLIGNASATLSFGNFTGTWSTSGTAGSDFTFSGNQLQTNGVTPTCTSATSLNLNIVATQPGIATPFPQAITVTCNPVPLATLSLRVTPSAPTIPSSDGTSGNVVALQGVWSDASTFTGKYIPVASNYDDNATFSISGSELIIYPSGPGVGSDGGTTQHVTFEAIQIDPTADLVMSSAPNGAPLATSAGVWSWTTRQPSSGNYAIYLNGQQPAPGNAGTLMEVAHGGQLYLNTVSSGWYLWNGTTFVSSAAP